MELAGTIEEILREKSCIVGVGNYLKRDDAAGLLIVDGLRERGASGPVVLMNVEEVPENYVYQIADLDCDHVIVVDAVESGGEIGSVIFGRLLELEEEAGDYSTHKLSLAMTARILEGCGKKVWLLGIQVEDTDFGAGLSDRVNESVCLIRDLIGTYIIGYRKELVYEH
jgi:hydrogenase 3 maturation protease